MLKKWRELDELKCVKRFGRIHKISHLLGTHMRSECMDAIAQVAMEGVVSALHVSEESNEDKLFESILVKRAKLRRAELMKEHRLEYGYEHPMSNDTYIAIQEEELKKLEEEYKSLRGD